jgi:hypothetical protein
LEPRNQVPERSLNGNSRNDREYAVMTALLVLRSDDPPAGFVRRDRAVVGL